jgi:hypothetical protein
MAQFGLMHDLATGILCQGSNSLVPNVKEVSCVKEVSYTVVAGISSSRNPGQAGDLGQ